MAGVRWRQASRCRDGREGPLARFGDFRERLGCALTSCRVSSAALVFHGRQAEQLLLNEAPIKPKEVTLQPLGSLGPGAAAAEHDSAMSGFGFPQPGEWGVAIRWQAALGRVLGAGELGAQPCGRSCHCTLPHHRPRPLLLRAGCLQGRRPGPLAPSPPSPPRRLGALGSRSLRHSSLLPALALLPQGSRPSRLASLQRSPLALASPRHRSSSSSPTPLCSVLAMRRQQGRFRRRTSRRRLGPLSPSNSSPGSLHSASRRSQRQALSGAPPSRQRSPPLRPPLVRLASLQRRSRAGLRPRHLAATPCSSSSRRRWWGLATGSQYSPAPPLLRQMLRARQLLRGQCYSASLSAPRQRLRRPSAPPRPSSSSSSSRPRRGSTLARPPGASRRPHLQRRQQRRRHRQQEGPAAGALGQEQRAQQQVDRGKGMEEGLTTRQRSAKRWPACPSLLEVAAVAVAEEGAGWPAPRLCRRQRPGTLRSARCACCAVRQGHAMQCYAMRGLAAASDPGFGSCPRSLAQHTRAAKALHSCLNLLEQPM